MASDFQAPLQLKTTGETGWGSRDHKVLPFAWCKLLKARGERDWGGAVLVKSFVFLMNENQPGLPTCYYFLMQTARFGATTSSCLAFGASFFLQKTNNKIQKLFKRNITGTTSTGSPNASTFKGTAFTARRPLLSEAELREQKWLFEVREKMAWEGVEKDLYLKTTYIPAQPKGSLLSFKNSCC